jgi:hypothetical protein
VAFSGASIALLSLALSWALVIETPRGCNGELGNTGEGSVEIEEIEVFADKITEAGEVTGVCSESNKSREVFDEGDCFVDDVKEPFFLVRLFRFCWSAASLRGGGGIFMIGPVRRRLTDFVTVIRIDDVGDVKTLSEGMTER